MAATKRIVLIDFDRKSLEATRQRLVEMGYEVTAVAEASQVNLALSGSPPDLVILEPMIPGKDGFALCRTIKQGKGGQVPKVILASRIYRTPRLKSLAHEAGADAWLERPRHDELLYQAVARLAPLPAVAPTPSPAVAPAADPGTPAEEEPTSTSLADLMIDDDELENVFSSLLQDDPGTGVSAPAVESPPAPAASVPAREADPLPNLWPDELGEQLSASGPVPTGAPAPAAASPAPGEERTAAVAVADPLAEEEVDDVLSRTLDLTTPQPEPAAAGASPVSAPEVTSPPEPTIELEIGDEPTGGPPPAPTGEQEIPEALRGMDRGTAELLSSLEELEDSIPVEETGTGSWPETGGLTAELESSVPLPPPPPPEEEQTLEEVLSKIQETSGVVPLAEATSPEELSGPALTGTGPAGQPETAEGPRPLPPLPPQFLPPRHERRSSWVGWFLGALAVGVILAGIVGAVWLGSRPEPPAPVQKVFPRPATPSPTPAGNAEPQGIAGETAASAPVRRLPTQVNVPARGKATGARERGTAAPEKATPRAKPGGTGTPAPSPNTTRAPASPGSAGSARKPAPASSTAPGALPASSARRGEKGREPSPETRKPAPPAGGEPGDAPAATGSAPGSGSREPATTPPASQPGASAPTGAVRTTAPAPAAAAATPEGRPLPEEASRRAPGATRTPPPRGRLEARPPARPRVHLPPPPEPPPAPSALAKPAPVVRLSELDHPLRRLAGQLPVLTPEAREAGIHGRVFLNLLVGPDGTVREARVMIEPGYGLGEAAARVVRTWRYSPPRRNGEPVRVWKTEVVEFRDAGNGAVPTGDPAPAP